MLDHTKRESLNISQPSNTGGGSSGWPSNPGNGTQGPARLRKKLQKINSKHQRNYLRRRIEPDAPNVESIENKPDNTTELACQASPQAPITTNGLPAGAPDLSDPKWADYLRRSGMVRPMDTSPKPKESPGGPTKDTVPEFSHLCVGAGGEKPRPSIDSSKGTGSSLSVVSSSLSVPSDTSSTMRRRRAKTPIFSIGQLEGTSPPSSQQTPLPDVKISPGCPPPHHGCSHCRRLRELESVELLAEEYRALLNTQPINMTAPTPTMADDSSRYSPTSGGTLVAFEEETVYFKPVSFSPEPSSPSSTSSLAVREPGPAVLLSPSSSPSSAPPLSAPEVATPDNLSLQICLDMLTRELSSAICDRSCKPTDMSSVQIWVMIEAYETLREQLLNMRLPPGQVRPIETMFDTWLRALYTIHDALTVERRTSKSDPEAL